MIFFYLYLTPIDVPRQLGFSMCINQNACVSVCNLSPSCSSVTLFLLFLLVLLLFSTQYSESVCVCVFFILAVLPLLFCFDVVCCLLVIFFISQLRFRSLLRLPLSFSLLFLVKISLILRMMY